MKYYKIRPEHDNKTRFAFHRGGGLDVDGIFVANELYLPSEAKKYLGIAAISDIVEVPKNKVYFFFGARFSA